MHLSAVSVVWPLLNKRHWRCNWNADWQWWLCRKSSHFVDGRTLCASSSKKWKAGYFRQRGTIQKFKSSFIVKIVKSPNPWPDGERFMVSLRVSWMFAGLLSHTKRKAGFDSAHNRSGVTPYKSMKSHMHKIRIRPTEFTVKPIFHKGSTLQVLGKIGKNLKFSSRMATKGTIC